MATFIEEVAAQLFADHGDDVSSLTMVLPSKRARLFFAEALLKIAGRPIWEPTYTSIDDLMCKFSDLRKADKLRLVAELYEVYAVHYGEDNCESFADFYHWGEMLVADFDMIDKYQVDASQLFSNITDLKEIESDVSYLSENQIDMINRFWRTMTGADSKIIDENSAKGKFLKMWRMLGPIYDEYRRRLRKLGIGYTGMIYREAVERMKDSEALSKKEKYVFVGFNALSKCEKDLLKYMQQNCRVDFFWDYDNYYTENKFQEAGTFIRENLEMYGPSKGISYDNFRNIQSVNVLSTSSNVAQCQCVVDILEDIASKSKDGTIGNDTAVVLTDENMLMPLLYALPEKFKVRREIKDGKEVVRPIINVTMGYPLRNTLAYSFIERLLELQKHAERSASGEENFYYVDVDGLLSHPYIADTSSAKYAELRSKIVEYRMFRVPRTMLTETPLLEKLFRKTENWRDESEYLLSIIDEVAASAVVGEDGAYRAEFLSVISDALVKLQNVAEQCGTKINEKIYRPLVRRYLQAERVPFTGEPLEGLQIMGILETRNLDFKNVILLSMTDNNFPGSRTSDKSFLPYSLRYGFNIPTAEQQEGVYAYYFYRLIERAENLYMLYSSAADDKSTGEPSRYIRQIEYETDFKIDYTNVGVAVSLSDSTPIEVEKDPEVFDKLLRFTRNKGLSPTAFSTYVKCPLKFYFNVVELLRPEDELDESIDNMTFGNIFHEAADILYKQIKGDPAPNVRLAELRKRGEVRKAVDTAIAKIYFGNKDGRLPQTLGGELYIIRNIVCTYLESNLLGYDIRTFGQEDGAIFKVFETEYGLKMTMPIEVNGEKFDVRLAGRADRIDTLNYDTMMRVIDYKTGKPRLNYAGIEALFHGEPIATQRESNIINTLMYSMMLYHEKQLDVRPELYYVGSMVREDYSPRFVENLGRGNHKTLNSYSECAEEFEREVRATLCEMFDRTIPFKQCVESSVCEYCDYQTICNRK